MNMNLWTSLYLIVWSILIIGGTGCIVFVGGYTGWWFLMSVVLYLYGVETIKIGTRKEQEKYDALIKNDGGKIK